jgi:hypothetical protein
MEPGLDRLSLAYNTFFADLEVSEPSSQQVAFHFAVTEMGRVEEAQLAIQLVLRPGELLETGATRVVLGLDRVELGPDNVAGVIGHRGWSLRVDSPARLVWPVFPYNPYANAPETSLGLAVGVLTVPIRPQDVGGRFRKQDVRFVLEATK